MNRSAGDRTLRRVLAAEPEARGVRRESVQEKMPWAPAGPRLSAAEAWAFLGRLRADAQESVRRVKR